MTLVARLRELARSRPHDPALRFLGDGGEVAVAYTYEALDAAVRGVAAALQARTRPGDRALLLFPPGADYAVSFLACLYAGVVAVPVYMPRGARQLPRLAAIMADAGPAIALTTHQALARGAEPLATLLASAGVPTLAVDGVGAPSPAGGNTDDLPAGDWVEAELPALAFLQYTSGSTGAPRGVRVGHAQLLHNASLIYAGFGHGPDSVALLWTPPYHDMGLIGGIVQPLYGGFPGILMSPLAFLKHPLGWLQAIDRYGVTTSGGPDFAYALCAQKAAGADLTGLDLSRWRVAFNGAEPIRPSTLEAFKAAFAPHGFAADAFYPCYGLAEATLIVSGGRATTAVGDDGVARVGAGRVLGGQVVAIVDPETLLPAEAGEIWVSGTSVADGYWNRPADRTFGGYLVTGHGPYLRTGDLGYRAESGELVVTGRLKDLVIVGGRNHHPHDIEFTAERAHAAMRPGGGAAFAVPTPHGPDGEGLVLVHEVGRHAAPAPVMAAIRRAVAAAHDLEALDVVLLPPGGLPRTSSGKVRRGSCREAYMRGELPVLASLAGP